MDIQQLTAAVPVTQAPAARREIVPASRGVAAQASVAAAESEPQPDQVKEAVKDIQEFVSSVTTDLRFSVDKETGRTIVSVVDSETKQVVRQIPAQEIMAIARNIDRMQGLLFSAKA